MGECHNFKDGDKSKTSRGGNFFKPLLKVEVKKKKSFSFDKCSKITT